MKRPRWTGLSAKALGRAAYVAAYRARRRQRDGTDRVAVSSKKEPNENNPDYRN